MRRIAAVLIASFIFYSFSSAQPVKSSPLVSIVQLLASPEKYEGKEIAVLGFLTIGQENNRLYLGKSDYDNVLLPNSIWVNPTHDMIQRRAELDRQYVRIVGTFRRKSFGQSTEFVGGLSDVTVCLHFSDPEHPLADKIRDRMP